MRLLSGLMFLFVLLVPVASADAQSQCADNIDNNGNSWVDMVDPYCKLPGDNDESSFRSGVPGDDTNLPRRLDTWFDLDSGSGNDDCAIHACCMIDGPCPANLEPGFFNPNSCTQSQACIDFAKPVTKPGCDCFGCCEVCIPGTSNCSTAFINPVVSPTCTIETLGNPAICRVCTQNSQCNVPPHIFQDGFDRAPAMPGA